MTSHTGRNIGIVALVITIVAGLYVVSGGNINLPQGNVGGSEPVTNTNTQVTPSTPNSYTGSITFQTVGTETTNGTAITLGTNAQVIFLWKHADGTFERAGAESDGGEAFPVGDHNIVYADVVIPSGQAFFVDNKNTLATNPDVKSVEYIDPLYSGVPSYVYAWDISKAKATGNPNFAPTVVFNPKFIADQTYFMATASSVLNVGTGSKSATIQENIHIDTNGGGEAFKALQVRVNGTQSTNEVAEEQSYWVIPDASKPSGVDNVYLSQMTASYDYANSVSIFRKDYSYTVNGANLIIAPQVGSNQINIPFVVGTNMDASTDGVCVELRMEPISARNVAGTALTDDVEIVAGSSNGNECSIT